MTIQKDTNLIRTKCWAGKNDADIYFHLGNSKSNLNDLNSQFLEVYQLDLFSNTERVLEFVKEKFYCPGKKSLV